MDKIPRFDIYGNGNYCETGELYDVSVVRSKMLDVISLETKEDMINAIEILFGVG